MIQFSDRMTLRGDRPSGVPYFEGVQVAMAAMRQVNEIQAADLSFVLDRLALLDESEKSSPFHGRLDFGRVAAVGHSLGGMTAVRACQRDARIKACVNLDGGTADGAFLQYPDGKPLEQPFLYVEATPPLTFTDQQLADRGITRADWTANASKVADTQEGQLRSGLGGSYKVQLRAAGMMHGSFEDTPLSATSPEARDRAFHNLMLTIDVTRAFLDKYIKGEKTTLMDTEGRSEIGIRKYPSSKTAARRRAIR